MLSAMLVIGVGPHGLGDRILVTPAVLLEMLRSEETGHPTTVAISCISWLRMRLIGESFAFRFHNPSSF